MNDSSGKAADAANITVPLPYALVFLPWIDDNGYGLTFDKQRDEDRAVTQAIKDGVVFEPSPDTSDVRDRNAKLLKQHIEARKTLQRRSFTREPGTDRKRRYALAALEGRQDDLARCTTGRDTATNDAIWYLAGFVNVGALSRDEVYDAIVASAYANGLDGDRTNGGIGKIKTNVDRGLDKATHEFDWTQVNWRTIDYVAAEKRDTMSDSLESDGFDGDGASHTWAPVDLADVLDGTWKPPTPTVGRRVDGVGLFYPGKKHTVSSESEAGKTWFALAACRDEIVRENHVLYVDFEDDSGPVVARLMLLGVDAARIARFFHYVRPESRIGLSPNGADISDALARYAPTLAVIDGVTEAMTLHELEPNDNSDIAKFGRLVPRLFAESGAAAVSLDHVTKSTDGRGRYSIGGVHKLNGLDGAAYILENRRPFGIDMQGVSTVRIAKDRPGQLRKYAVPNKSGMFWFADLIVDTTLDGMADGVASVVPAVDGDSEYKPTIIMARVRDALTSQPDGLSQRVLCDVVTGKTDTIRLALSHLIADGYVTTKTPHKLIRPYLEDSDSDGEDR